MIEAMQDAVMRAAATAAGAVERELRFQLESGRLVSGVARVDNRPLTGLIMSGNLVLAEVRTVREVRSFRVETLRYGDGIPFEEWDR